jgi:hypothetical protein
MVNYRNGCQVIKGDLVLMYGERAPGVVEEILDSVDVMNAWGVREPSILFRSERFGLVQESFDSFHEEPFELISRANPADEVKND